MPFSPQWGKSSNLLVTGICCCCCWEAAMVGATRTGDLWMRFLLLRRGGAWIIYCSLMRHMGESWYEESYHRSGTGSRSKNRAGTSDGGVFHAALQPLPYCVGTFCNFKSLSPPLPQTRLESAAALWVCPNGHWPMASSTASHPVAGTRALSMLNIISYA